MSEPKIIMFPEMGNGGGHNSTIDPALLMALNQNGGFGGAGGFLWVIFLFFLYPLMRNGGFFGNGNGFGGNCGEGGFGPLANMINNNDGRQLLDAAINRNGAAIDKLATMFGCKADTISAAINQVQAAIAQTTAQTAAGISDVRYAIGQQGQEYTRQLAECCCNIRETITAQGYQNQLQTVQQTNALQQSINGVAVGAQQNTCEVKGAIKDLSTQVATQFANLETRALQDKLDAVREANSTLKAQLSNEHQTALIGQQIAAATAPLGAAIGSLQGEVNDIKCKLPQTVTLPYSCATAIPTDLAYRAQFGLGLNNVGAGSIWSV